MAVTANGTPYVESSDLVANYPGVSLALANHIDDVSAILQIVRATDVTTRTTTSATYVDVTGMSVTITPQKSTSAIMVIATFNSQTIDSAGGATEAYYQITDTSNSAISGTQENAQAVGNTGATTTFLYNTVTIIGYATPATTSATTYKLRFRQGSATLVTVANAVTTGQLYAIEVSAL